MFEPYQKNIDLGADHTLTILLPVTNGDIMAFNNSNQEEKNKDNEKKELSIFEYLLRNKVLVDGVPLTEKIENLPYKLVNYLVKIFDLKEEIAEEDLRFF